MGIRITGLGRAQGSQVLTNADLEARLDTSDEWIRTRTGISERRIVADGETTATMSADAARDALKKSGREDVDLTIVATTTPESPLPSTASWVQAELGLGGGAFDLQAACSGWVYAVVVASGLIDTGVVESVLVIGAESLSTILNFADRSTAPLFGDAAGAAVIEACEGPGDMLACDIGNDGDLIPLLWIPAGGSREQLTAETLGTRDKITMNGPEVFRAATRVVVETCEKTLEAAGLGPDDIDLFVPHQANARIISYASEKLGIPAERTVVNIDRYGNTSAASIPVALSEVVDGTLDAAGTAPRIEPGSKVLVAGFGAGMSWASAVFDWSLT